MGLETQSTRSIKSRGLISSGPQDLYTFRLTISFRTISAVTKRLMSNPIKGINAGGMKLA